MTTEKQNDSRPGLNVDPGKNALLQLTYQMTVGVAADDVLGLVTIFQKANGEYGFAIAGNISSISVLAAMQQLMTLMQEQEAKFKQVIDLAESATDQKPN